MSIWIERGEPRMCDDTQEMTLSSASCITDVGEWVADVVLEYGEDAICELIGGESHNGEWAMLVARPKLWDEERA